MVNLLKTFVKWVKDPDADESTFQKMIAVIAQCEMTGRFSIYIDYIVYIVYIDYRGRFSQY